MASNNNTRNNTLNILSGTGNVLAAFHYEQRANEAAGLTSDLITGRKTTGSKAGDVALGILSFASIAANIHARDEAINEAGRNFGSVRW